MKCMLPHVYILQCGDDYCKKKKIIIMEKNKQTNKQKHIKPWKHIDIGWIACSPFELLCTVL